ncbi:hypothetical protein DFA_07385 [Cavenderia fasciculata]|uniref:Uncharacterized protein n=1 Tax=Cavenderia fasciculata TaxID=261658 RepID=F4PW98_CACFS|nr:uncharacterized protein DFA_07385 [Cavenderia fasciculata]EGG20262.1 hypothetical protein DFA_07385 [Cavenderia fasciculata]|eukprot:XP_004367245.1 hypothetical protein DFA_07385 [Cavenderia fasciculata]
MIKKKERNRLRLTQRHKNLRPTLRCYKNLGLSWDLPSTNFEVDEMIDTLYPKKKKKYKDIE